MKKSLTVASAQTIVSPLHTSLLLLGIMHHPLAGAFLIIMKCEHWVDISYPISQSGSCVKFAKSGTPFKSKLKKFSGALSKFSHSQTFVVSQSVLRQCLQQWNHLKNKLRLYGCCTQIAGGARRPCLARLIGDPDLF